VVCRNVRKAILRNRRNRQTPVKTALLVSPSCLIGRIVGRQGAPSASDLYAPSSLVPQAQYPTPPKPKTHTASTLYPETTQAGMNSFRLRSEMD
jgi:hypothetical protein